MYFSFYDNEEAMERSCLLVAIFLWASGFSILAWCLWFTAIQVEDEERVIEEQLLDTGEPTLLYAMNVQRDVAAQHFAAKGTIFGSDPERNASYVEKYVFEDYMWERSLLTEIYAIPTSTILSNSYYLIPHSEDPQLLGFLGLARQQLFSISIAPERSKLRHLSHLKPSPNFLPEIPWLSHVAAEDGQLAFEEIAPFMDVDPELEGDELWFWVTQLIGPFPYLIKYDSFLRDLEESEENAKILTNEQSET